MSRICQILIRYPSALLTEIWYSIQFTVLSKLTVNKLCTIRARQHVYILRLLYLDCN